MTTVDTHPRTSAPRSPVRRNLLRDQVRHELIDRILDGRLRPGDRLNEVELAAELGISRTPLKEAILGMEREGFVQASRSRGHVVTPLSQTEVEEVYPVLLTLETLIISEYPPSAETLDKMTAIDKRLADAESPAERLRLDNEFHAALSADCTNSRLVETAQSLEMVVRRYHVRYPHTTAQSESVHRHEMVVDALRAGDTAAAIRANEEHWRKALVRLVDAMREDPPA